MNLVKIGPVGGSNGSCWDFKGRDQVAGIFLLSLAQKLFIHFSSFYMSMVEPQIQVTLRLSWIIHQNFLLR
ncbi:hypothetical protein H5410_048425 [Solanum commersonii]|uniref:Uncharacterized protein n=1 Tax=Solanum commersonii TaxID=4109 RepID=A0A9J5XKC9_SOLCO|nr:hypothetical protein H5410_048425 [Solanum commersonii]